jgi:hypothetical protein
MKALNELAANGAHFASLSAGASRRGDADGDRSQVIGKALLVG